MNAQVNSIEPGFPTPQVQEDGTVRRNTVAATLDYWPRLEDSSPSGGYYFAKYEDLPVPGQPEKMGRDHFYQLHIAGRAVEQILTGIDQSLRNALSITRSAGNLAIAIKGDPIPRGTTPSGTK